MISAEFKSEEVQKTLFNTASKADAVFLGLGLWEQSASYAQCYDKYEDIRHRARRFPSIQTASGALTLKSTVT
jgi:DNA-binding transcriptional regulator LsrR (DeoR family)